MKHKPLIAFIDVLATKESARVSSRDFEFSIKEFNRAICSQARILDFETDKVKLFGNCAFIQFNSGLETALSFLQYIRYSLFCNQVYFKCVLSFGNLDSDGFNPLKGVHGDDLVKVEKIVDANYFGLDSIKAFTFHEKFKGIGFYIDPQLNAENPSLFIESGFFSDAALTKFSSSVDIKFGLVLDSVFYREQSTLLEGKDEAEVEKMREGYQEDESFINTVLRSVFISHAKKPEYSRYYISSLISSVRSSDFSQLRFDEAEKKWDAYPAIFKKMFIDELHFKHFRSIPSLNVPFFCMVDVILKSGTQAVRDEMLRKIVERKTLVEKLKMIPEALLSSSSKQNVLSTYAKRNI